jgi:hypothetical protein
MTQVLFAYVDSDMDGVEDKHDSCPNTLMTDLVDLSGCVIESLVSPHHFSVMAGASYANDEANTYTFSSIELDYYYKKFSLQLSTSYYDLKSDTLNQEGMNDTYLNFYYKFKPSKNFSLTLGTGLALPSYDGVNNKIDYGTSIYGRYRVDKWSFSTGGGYTLIGDTNASNRLFYNVSTGYSWNSKVYSSIGYYVSESIYDGVGDFESLSLYNYYSINKNWFTTVSFTQGLNDVSLDNSMGVKVGYYW